MIVVVTLNSSQFILPNFSDCNRTKREKNKSSNEERQNIINFSLTFEKREDKKISGICGTEVASHETNMILKCLYLDVHTVWVKKYVHLRMESKTGHNVRLFSSTTSFAISYKLQEKDCAFPKIPCRASSMAIKEHPHGLEDRRKT